MLLPRWQAAGAKFFKPGFEPVQALQAHLSWQEACSLQLPTKPLKHRTKINTMTAKRISFIYRFFLPHPSIKACKGAQEIKHLAFR